MASRIVRQSKVRHVFADPAKAENTYQSLQLSTSTGDHNYIKANSRYFAVAVRGGGGPLLVHPFEKPGKMPAELPLISGHKGTIFDFDFNPFVDTMIATGSDDTTVKVWSFPEGGPTETITEPLVDLVGHGRKVNFTLFHPTASNVLATASADYTVRLWDIEAGETRATLEDFTQLVQDLKWNTDGSLLATSSKDKMFRIHDPRATKVVAETQAFEGSKCSKVCWLGTSGRIATTGFTKQSKRQLKIWDHRDLSAPLKVRRPPCVVPRAVRSHGAPSRLPQTTDIDQAAGVIMPFYDPDSSILFLAGKVRPRDTARCGRSCPCSPPSSQGDGNIRYYEIVDGEPYEYHINTYRSTKSAKGMAMLPKRGMDVHRNELVRLLKLTNESVEPISFICPRKVRVPRRPFVQAVTLPSLTLLAPPRPVGCIPGRPVPGHLRGPPVAEGGRVVFGEQRRAHHVLDGPCEGGLGRRIRRRRLLHAHEDAGGAAEGA